MRSVNSERANAFSGRAYDMGCPILSTEQWRHVGRIVADAERVANEFGLDLVSIPRRNLHISGRFLKGHTRPPKYGFSSARVGSLGGDRGRIRHRERRSFQKGREFAAWLGLVPRQWSTGTGNHTRLHFPSLLLIWNPCGAELPSGPQNLPLAAVNCRVDSERCASG